MRVLAVPLALALSVAPVLAQQPAPQPIRAAAHDAAVAAAARHDDQQSVDRGRGKLFWPGAAVGVAGATMAVLGTTVFKVEDSSTGNAPAGTYQACVAQKQNPIYASNDCEGLKGKNLKLLWGGVALGAAGAVMMIGSAGGVGAELGPGGVRLFRRVRF